jgi:purine-binding chemotaxis protein CheW
MSAHGQAVASTENPMSQWVTFSLGEETYGINVMQVQEVLKMTEIAPVPGAPDYVIGIINLRGNVVTVVDTRSRFGLPPQDPTDSTRIVIIEANGQVVGILVDGVAEVVELNADDIETAPAVGNDETARYIQGVHSREDRLIILVDLDKFLSEEELDEIGEL